MAKLVGTFEGNVLWVSRLHVCLFFSFCVCFVEFAVSFDDVVDVLWRPSDCKCTIKLCTLNQVLNQL